MKLFMELNTDISELNDSIDGVLVTILPEMCRQVMPARDAVAAICVQLDCQCLENLCKVANLRFSRKGHHHAEAAPFLKNGTFSKKSKLASISRVKRKLALYTDSRSICRPTGRKVANGAARWASPGGTWRWRECTIMIMAADDGERTFRVWWWQVLPRFRLFTDIVVQLHEHFLIRARALTIQEGIDRYISLFPDEIAVTYVNEFLVVRFNLCLDTSAGYWWLWFSQEWYYISLAF